MTSKKTGDQSPHPAAHQTTSRPCPTEDPTRQRQYLRLRRQPPSTPGGPADAIHETTDARDRATGFVLRMLPLTAIWLILSTAAAIVLGMLAGTVWAAVGGLMLWGVLTAITYLAHDTQERRFAAGGIERHRLDLAHDLERRRIEHDAEARRAVIQAYLKRMEG